MSDQNSDDGSPLQDWLGGEAVTWITLPRVLVDQMPNAWQDRLWALLMEFEVSYVNLPKIKTRVALVDGHKVVPTPRWINRVGDPDDLVIGYLRGEFTQVRSDDGTLCECSVSVRSNSLVLKGLPVALDPSPHQEDSPP